MVDVTDHELTAQMLHATLESMIDPHVVFDIVHGPDGRALDAVYRSVNQAACAYLEAPSADVVGRGVVELFASETAQTVVGWCQRALDEGTLVLDDVPLVIADEELPRWFDVRAVRVADAIGFTWRDVSDRHEAAAQLAEREAQYRLLADHATDVIMRSGADSCISWVSPSLAEVLGWSPDEVIGKRMPDLMHPEDLAAVRKVQQAIFAAGGTEGRTTARFATADGGWRWMSDHGRAILGPDGRIMGGIDALRDVQAEHDAAEALAEQQRVLRGIIDTLVDPWVHLASVRDAAGQIVDFEYVDANDAACAFNGLPREQLIGARLLEILPEHRPSGIFAKYAQVAESGAPLFDDDEPFTSPTDGSVRRFDNRAARVGDGISLTWRDVTDRFEARQHLRQQADHDVLTGVANRRQLERRLEELFVQAPRTGTRLALLYCDVDHFKEINDTLGHAAGDEVLSRVADAIRSAVRDRDLVARLGGDEFVVILDGVRGAVDAEAVAHKVAGAVHQPISIGGLTVHPQISVGVAITAHGEDPHHALARADEALYEAKRTGRNRVVVDGAT